MYRGLPTLTGSLYTGLKNGLMEGENVGAAGPEAGSAAAFPYQHQTAAITDTGVHIK